MRNLIVYIKTQAIFFFRTGLYLLAIFVLFLIALDLYGQQIVYVKYINVYAPQEYQRDIPLIRWVNDKDVADGYIDEDGFLHIQTYNQLKRNLMIYLFSGESSDWKVVVVKNMLSMDMIEFYNTLYGIFYLLVVVTFTAGYNVMYHKINGTGSVWRLAGVSKWGIVGMEIVWAFIIALLAFIFHVPVHVFLPVTIFLIGFGIMVGMLAKSIESYTVLIKGMSILFVLPLLYFVVGDSIPKFVWYVLPTFHPIMIIASPVVNTPLSLSVHVGLTVFFSVLMIGIPTYLSDF